MKFDFHVRIRKILLQPPDTGVYTEQIDKKASQNAF